MNRRPVNLRFYVRALCALSIALFLTVTLGTLVAIQPAMAQTPEQHASEQHVSQTVLVQFASGTSEEQRMARITELGGELVHWMPQIGVAEVRLLQSEAGGAAMPMAAAANSYPEITFIEPDLPVLGVALPSDPAFATAATSYAFTRIQAAEAWDFTTGSAQIVIAVVDSGIRLDHPDLVGQTVPGYDFVNEDADPSDDSGHGTHVAGLIAAAHNNGHGLAGVCPGCRLMPIKVLDARNMGGWANLARGILYAVDHGAQIINLSLGSSASSNTLQEAITYARNHGVVIVAAAGNNGASQPFYPAALDGVLGVGATSARDEWWSLSNYGSFVDLTAPGDLIYSAYHQLDNIYGGYTYMSGTSMATPLVSGLAGLILSRNPTLSPEDVHAVLFAGADDLGAPGYDPYFGHGRINAYHSLSLVTETLPAANPSTLANRSYLPLIQSH